MYAKIRGELLLESTVTIGDLDDETSASITEPLGLTRLLRESKFRVPSPGRATVSRARLIQRAVSTQSRVVAVAAPAGYGKSTMLAEWAAAEARPVVWVSLDEHDDDPAVLLTLLAAACILVSPAVSEVVDDMRRGGVATLGRSAPLLAAALATAPLPFVLFIDDIHALASPACHDILDVVLKGVSEGSQIVASGRHYPKYLARSRVEGNVFEIGPDDLRITTADARPLFLSVDLSDDDLDRLVERCEGWPVGLMLCALIASNGGDLRTFTGNDRFVSDYLYRESMAGLPEDLQRFLRRTAVLSQFSARTCDDVLEIRNSAEHLRVLEEKGLFLVPLDRARGWYRYHALFREYLIAEFQRIDAAEFVETHARAAAWYEANGLAPQAIDHFLAAGDRANATRLIGSVALPMHHAGQLGQVNRWLSEVGDAALLADPLTAALAAWVAVLQGEPVAAERWAILIDQIDESGGARVTQEFLSLRAMLRASMCRDGVRSAVAESAFAVDSLEPWSPWREQVYKIHGTALFMTDDAVAAREAFTEAARLAPALGTDAPRVNDAYLAILDIEDGDWSTASRRMRAALIAIEGSKVGSYSTTSLAYAVGARIAVHDGDSRAAERLMSKAMCGRVACTYAMPSLAIPVRIQLAKAYLARSDRAAAELLLSEIDDILHQRPDLGRLVVDAAAVRHQLAGVSGVNGTMPLTLAELRLLPYLQTHLTLAEIGGRLSVSRNTVNSQVASIYRKLDAATRSAAVARAIDVGLLGGS